MKRRNLFMTLGLALTLGVGVAVGVNSGEAREAKAVAEEKTVWVEIGNNCDWSTGKIAIGFWGAGDHWTNLVSINSTDKFYKLTYTTNDGDTGCSVVLFGTAKETPDWEGIVNQTKDMSIGNQYTVWNKHDEDGKYWFNVNYRDTTKSASLTGDLNIDFDSFKRGEEDALESVKAGIAVTAGQKFKVSYDGVEYALLNDYVNKDWFDTTTNTGYITALATGNFDMYFNTVTHKIWIEEDADAAATTFAETFLSVTGSVCKNSEAGKGDTDLSALAAKWNPKATPDGTSLVELWGDLTPAAKQSFAAGTANETLEDAHARYVHIMSRYSATLTAFNNGPSFSVATGISFANNSSANNSTITIVVITALVLFTTGLFFVAYKRKHSK